MIRRAIIPAAGLGTRVLPASKAVPKEMLPIVDKPAIQYIVEEAVAAGITDILIVTNRGKGVIEGIFVAPCVFAQVSVDRIINGFSLTFCKRKSHFVIKRETNGGCFYILKHKAVKIFCVCFALFIFAVPKLIRVLNISV